MRKSSQNDRQQFGRQCCFWDLAATLPPEITKASQVVPKSANRNILQCPAHSRGLAHKPDIVEEERMIIPSLPLAEV